MKVILVEDEKNLARSIKYLLNSENIEVDHADDGLIGYRLIKENLYDVIILDIMLPSMDGYSILKKIREEGNKTPVMFLTAKNTTLDKVNGLNLGADDYLAKPFNNEELVARIKALNRRSNNLIDNSIKYKDLELNLLTGILKCGEEEIKLNFKEKELLKLLLTNPNVCLSKDLIFNKIWNEDSEASLDVIEAYISFLRRKLKYLNSKVSIKNYQKYGYKVESND